MNTARIVIVEDNRDVADLFRELLERWGHVAVVAYDGESGIRAHGRARRSADQLARTIDSPASAVWTVSTPVLPR